MPNNLISDEEVYYFKKRISYRIKTGGGFFAVGLIVVILNIALAGTVTGVVVGVVFLVIGAAFFISILSLKSKTERLVVSRSESNKSEFDQNLQLAQGGDPDAQLKVALSYEDDQDFIQAFKWFFKSAEQGNARSLFEVGFAYQNGRGIEKDPAKAFEFYSIASDQGYHAADNWLGVFYRDGLHVKQDDLKACEYFKAAAEKNNIGGCLNYGLALLEGRGCDPDRAKAIEYLTIAARNNSQAARSKLNELLGGKSGF